MNIKKLSQCVCDHEVRIEELEQGGGGGGIPEAPEDGNIYGRQDGEWVEVTGGGSSVTIGSSGEIPFVNNTSDDLDYDSNFNWDGSGIVVNSGSGTQSYVTDDSFQLRQSSNAAFIVSAAINANRTHTLQNRTGTLAHLDQINKLAIVDTTTSMVLSSGNEFETVVFTNSSAVTVTIPDDSTYDHTIGTQIVCIQAGTGQVSIEGESSATINGVSSVDTNGQYFGILLIKTAANTWIGIGYAP